MSTLFLNFSIFRNSEWSTLHFFNKGISNPKKRYEWSHYEWSTCQVQMTQRQSLLVPTRVKIGL